MRPAIKIGIFVALAVAIAVLMGIVWTDRALAAMQSNATPICLTGKDRRDIAGDKFGRDKQDRLVAKAINFNQGRTRMAWWHLRGAATHITYVTFWSSNRRERAFAQLTSRMRDCSRRTRVSLSAA